MFYEAMERSESYLYWHHIELTGRVPIIVLELLHPDLKPAPGRKSEHSLAPSQFVSTTRHFLLLLSRTSKSLRGADAVGIFSSSDVAAMALFSARNSAGAVLRRPWGRLRPKCPF